MKKIITTLMLALGLAVSTTGVAQAHYGGDLTVDDYSSHSVYYRYGPANQLAYANPGGYAPHDRDVNYVQVANCWRLRYAFAGDAYARTSGSGADVAVGNTQTIVIYDYYKVC